MNTDERLAELEIRLSFQDELLATLNDVVTAQSFRLEQLQRELETLRQTLAQGGLTDPGAATGQLTERPPHY